MGFELMILAGVAYMLEVSGALAGIGTVAAIGGAAVVGSAVGLAIKDARDPTLFRSPSPYGPGGPPRPPASDQTSWDVEPVCKSKASRRKKSKARLPKKGRGRTRHGR